LINYGNNKKRSKKSRYFNSNCKVKGEVIAFICAASAKKALRRTRIGLVGYMSMNMYPASFNHLLMSALIGPEIIHFDTFTLLENIKSIENDQIMNAKEKICKVEHVNISEEKGYLWKIICPQGNCFKI
jgi:L-fucose isomerase-like protein